ncbi:MAG: hypothetical protein ABJB10_19985 [Mesorhizobium sp.]
MVFNKCPPKVPVDHAIVIVKGKDMWSVGYAVRAKWCHTTSTRASSQYQDCVGAKAVDFSDAAGDPAQRVGILKTMAFKRLRIFLGLKDDPKAIPPRQDWPILKKPEWWIVREL